MPQDESREKRTHAHLHKEIGDDSRSRPVGTARSKTLGLILSISTINDQKLFAPSALLIHTPPGGWGRHAHGHTRPLHVLGPCRHRSRSWLRRSTLFRFTAPLDNSYVARFWGKPWARSSRGSPSRGGEHSSPRHRTESPHSHMRWVLAGVVQHRGAADEAIMGEESAAAREARRCWSSSAR